MHLNDINYLINLQDVFVSIFEKDTEHSTLFLSVEISNPIQACPCCGVTHHTILKGIRPYPRLVRHLDCLAYQTYLRLPSIRLYCTKCDCSFTYIYDFVGERERYTYSFQKQLFRALEGTTIQYVAEKYDLPYTTCERIIKQQLAKIVPDLQETVVKQAEETDYLVIGIDDFANRKGHTYNTGFHDLRNGSLLAVTFGRTYSQLTQRSHLKAI